MTVDEKIKAIVDKKWSIAWDGCHKIYFMTTMEQVVDAAQTGYAISPAEKLPSIWERSCFLRFVSSWPLLPGEDAEALEIHQFEDEPPEDVTFNIEPMDEPPVDDVDDNA